MSLTTDMSLSSQWTTFCEIGADAPDGARVVHDRIEGPEAYEHFALARYLKQALALRELANRSQAPLEDIPRKEKVLFLFEMLRFFGVETPYFEIGASVFEVIDGLETLNSLLGAGLDFRATPFYGIEAAASMRATAHAIHPGHRIAFVDGIAAMPDGCLLYDRAVSSYCFSAAAELAAVMNRSRAVFANLLLTIGPTQAVINSVGKTQTYFNQFELAGALQKPLYHLFGRERGELREATRPGRAGTR